MGVKIKTVLLLLTFFLFNQFSMIQAEESVELKENDNFKVKTEKNSNKTDINVKSESDTNKKSANEVESESIHKSGKLEDTSEKKIEKTTSKNKTKTKTNGNILKNPGLMQEFKDVNYDDSPTDRVADYLFYGLLTGGIMGMGGGLAFYTTSNNLTPLYISAGGVGAAGAVTGVIVALIENSVHNPLIGSDLLKYTWYGVVGGAMIGGLAGLIPYSTTKNINSILNGIGYGSYAGIGVGMALFFVLPKSTLKNIIIDINPVESRIGYKISF
ncbi:MAG: hypothetical protein OEV78_06145 [Spirochaetia bacterium]|nr:hypothetical protein [Spirochaetia bacterium]